VVHSKQYETRRGRKSLGDVAYLNSRTKCVTARDMMSTVLCNWYQWCCEDVHGSNPAFLSKIISTCGPLVVPALVPSRILLDTVRDVVMVCCERITPLRQRASNIKDPVAASVALDSLDRRMRPPLLLAFWCSQGNAAHKTLAMISTVSNLAQKLPGLFMFRNPASTCSSEIVRVFSAFHWSLTTAVQKTIHVYPHQPPP
jgi:hypothetical protein